MTNNFTVRRGDVDLYYNASTGKIGYRALRIWDDPLLSVNVQLVDLFNVYQAKGWLWHSTNVPDEFVSFFNTLGEAPAAQHTLLENIVSFGEGEEGLQILQRFIADIRENANFTEAVIGNVGLVRAWEQIRFSPQRTDVDLLSKVEVWHAEGATFAPFGSDDIIRMDYGSDYIGAIMDGKLLANHYVPGFTGTPVGSVINNCQVYKSASGQLVVKRVPDTSPYNAGELAVLQSHPSAHALEKHGPTVTDEALQWRAITGVAPNGQAGNVVNGTKFGSAENIKTSLAELGPGTPRYNAKLSSLTPQEIASGGFAIEYEFPTSMGYGFRKNTLEHVPEVKKVLAAYKFDDATGQYFLITMYPKI